MQRPGISPLWSTRIIAGTWSNVPKGYGTANLPIQHADSLTSCPSSVPTNLHEQTIDGYVNIASFHQSPTEEVPVEHLWLRERQREPNHSRKLAPTEFAYTFSLIRDSIPNFPPTFRKWMTTCFFYQYHIHFTSSAAVFPLQFNEDIFERPLNNKIHISAAGAPSVELHLSLSFPVLSPVLGFWFSSLFPMFTTCAIGCSVSYFFYCVCPAFICFTWVLLLFPSLCIYLCVLPPFFASS